MAILKGADGKFYEVPDGDLENFEIPAEEVKDKLGEAAAGGGPGGPAPRGGVRAMGTPQVLVQVYGGGKGGRGRTQMTTAPAGGEVAPYGHCGGWHCGGGRHCGHHCGHCGRHCGGWCW